MRELSKRGKQIYSNLEAKVLGTRKVIPNIHLLSELLSELGIKHSVEEVESRREIRHTLNGRFLRDGSRVYKGYLMRVSDLKIDTTSSEFTKKSYSYAKKLKDIIDSYEKENQLFG